MVGAVAGSILNWVRTTTEPWDAVSVYDPGGRSARAAQRQSPLPWSSARIRSDQTSSPKSTPAGATVSSMSRLGRKPSKEKSCRSLSVIVQRNETAAPAAPLAWQGGGSWK
jgi:hypothetical protein